jgi:hypothetical protein
MSGSQTPISGGLRQFSGRSMKTRSPNPKPEDPRGRPGSSCAFSGDFSGGINGFSGGFAMKNPWGKFLQPMMINFVD